MTLNDNLSLDRYQWAGLKVKEILDAKPNPSFSIFDVGSRDNILKEYLADQPLSYKGFDLEPLTDAEKWDIETPFPYSYRRTQVVTLLEVIEHLKNPGICLKNVSDIIEPGGYLILTTPNPKWSNSRLNLLFSGELNCFTRSDLELNHHVFIPWTHILEKFIHDAGFEITEYVTLDGRTIIFDKTLFKGNVLKKLFARTVKKLIEFRDPSSRGMSYGIVAKRLA